jgi:hypothetical protein
MRVSMAAIIHRARWNFNVDEADGVSRRDRTSGMGVSPRGPTQPRAGATPAEAPG